MNKPFIVFVMLLGSLLLAASCEKMVISGSERSDAEDANVVVQVMSFEQLPFSLTRTRGETETGPTRLNFIVYDEDGMRIRQESQQLGDDEFGIARFKLQEGRYFLVALAHSGKGNPTSTDLHKIRFTNKTGYTDTFLYADTLVLLNIAVDYVLLLSAGKLCAAPLRRVQTAAPTSPRRCCRSQKQAQPSPARPCSAAAGWH